MRCKPSLIPACLTLLLLSVDLAADTSPLEHFAQRAAISSVRVSPDGERLLQLAVPECDQYPLLEIHDTDDLAAEPQRVSAGNLEMMRAEWTGNDGVVIELRHTRQDSGAGLETRVALLDVGAAELRFLDVSGALLENVLPHDADRIIVSSASSSAAGETLSQPAEFRPRDYYAVDLRSGTTTQLFEARPLIANVSFDASGSPWLARGFDAGAQEFVWSRHGDDGWQEIYRQHEDSHESFTVYGTDPDDAEYLIVGARNGHDKIGIWTFDSRRAEFGDLIYRRDDVDVAGVRLDSNRWARQGTIAGIQYFGDRYYYEYFDEVEAAGYAQLEGLIHDAYSTVISSKSADGETMTVWNETPSNPGSLYLVRNALLKRIGSRQPLLEGKQLADVEYITFDTRDRREMAAFLTVPRGKGPHPLVVLPHDGPFERQVVIYDAWAQMLADNGYLVVQPQFRGSLGYGGDHWHAALLGGGQGGYSMQDDKDDAAKFLVRQGLADRSRMAMFGWGYGGYAALVAAARTPQLYRCVAAAAAVPDTAAPVAYYRAHARGYDRRRNVDFWRDSVNPLDEVGQLNVPVLLMHGDNDQRVDIAHIRRYAADMEEAGKRHSLLILGGAGHEAATLTVANTVSMFRALIDFLAEECL